MSLANPAYGQTVRALVDSSLQPNQNSLWCNMLYHHFPAICFILDATGHIEQISQMATQRLGYEPDAVLGKPLSSLVFAEHEDVATAWLGWIHSPQTLHTWHTHLRCRDQMPIPVHVAVQVVHQDDRIAVILVCTEQQDIALGDRPHPSPLPHCIHPLNSLLEQTTVALLCYRLRPSGEWDYLYCSAGCQQVFGYTAAELMADPPLWLSRVSPDDRKIFRQLDVQAHPPSWLEYQFTHRDGSLRWIASDVTVGWDGASEFRIVTLMSRDITERKYFELALQQSRSDLAYVLDMAGSAIFNMRLYADDHWTYDYISAGCEQVYGYAPEEHYADPNLWRRIVHPGDYDRIITEMTAAIRDERPLTHIFRVFHRDGSIRWVASNYSSRWDESLQCWRVIVVDFDVSDRHRTEEALSQSKARLAEAQQIAQLGSWEFDLTTCQITWSAELYRIYQWDPSVNVALEALLQRFPSPDRQRLMRVAKQAIACGDSYVLDLSMIRPDGTSCALEMRGQTLCDLQGNVVRLYGTVQDITQRKHLEYQLQWKSQREQLLNQVIRAIRHSLDLETVFRTATSQTGRLLKLDRAQITQYFAQEDSWVIHCEYRVQEHMADMQGQRIPGHDNPLSERLRRMETIRLVQAATLSDPINRQLAQKAPGNWLLVPLSIDGGVWGSLSLIRAQDKQEWQDWEVDLAEAIADQLAIAIQQSELFRQVKHLNSVLESTVQRRTAQLTQSLQHESLVRRITDRVRDSLDEDHILQTAVQELLAELKLECCDAGIYNLETQTSTIAYESIRGMAPARNTVIKMAHYSDIYRQLFAGISFQFCDIQQFNHRKKSHLYTMLVCPIYDDQGSLGDLWLFRSCEQFFDGLEVRLVEQVANQCAIALRQSRLYDAAQRQVEELAKLNQLKDDFLSTVSHELRSPMANIKMATEMLEMYLAHTEILIDEKTRSAQYFRILRDECERESTLINDLLDLSRLEADSEPLLCSTLDLYDWILHLSEAFQYRTESHQQRLNFDLPPNIPPLTTDFTFLERILTELLHNACKYTPEGGTITLSLRFFSSSTTVASTPPASWQMSSHSLWEITVTNTGTEIPLVEQERIFDKFYRIPNNDPWRTGGTGLGLALVKKRVERLGGQIEVSSANLRTAFVIKLPCLS